MNEVVNPGPRNGSSTKATTARSRIETHLAGAMKSDRPTHTM
jgi:Tfp pilus assembly protein PilZ